MEPKITSYVVGAIITFIIFALPASRGAGVSVSVSFMIALIWPVAIFVSAQRVVGQVLAAVRGNGS